VHPEIARLVSHTSINTCRPSRAAPCLVRLPCSHHNRARLLAAHCSSNLAPWRTALVIALPNMEFADVGQLAPNRPGGADIPHDERQTAPMPECAAESLVAALRLSDGGSSLATQHVNNRCVIAGVQPCRRNCSRMRSRAPRPEAMCGSSWHRVWRRAGPRPARDTSRS